MTTRETRDWKKVRRVYLDAHPKGWFPRNWVDFELVDDQVGYVDDEAVLTTIGITLLDGDGAACFCGYPGAKFNRDTRRFNCGKPSNGGCGIYWMSVLSVVHRWAATSGSRILKSVRSSSRPSNGRSYIYVH